MPRSQFLTFFTVVFVGLFMAWGGNWHLASRVEPEWGWLWLVLGAGLFLTALFKQAMQIEALCDDNEKLERRIKALESKDTASKS